MIRQQYYSVIALALFLLCGCFESQELLFSRSEAVTPLVPGRYVMASSIGEGHTTFSLTVDGDKIYTQTRLEEDTGNPAGEKEDKEEKTVRFLMAPFPTHSGAPTYVVAALPGIKRSADDEKGRGYLYAIVRIPKPGTVEELLPDCPRAEDQAIAVKHGASKECLFHDRKQLFAALGDLLKGKGDWSRYVLENGAAKAQ